MFLRSVTTFSELNYALNENLCANSHGWYFTESSLINLCSGLGVAPMRAGDK